MERRYSREYYLMNEILMEWNPIGVTEGGALRDEYTYIIPRLLKIRNNKELLEKELTEILINYFGLVYNSNIPSQRNDLLKVIDKITNIK